MSLRVWLPLNGDLTNNGLSDVTVTNNGATVDNSGKIGKCYYFSGSPNFINTGYATNIGTNDFSIALWIKIPTITTGTYYTICSSKTASAASVGFGIYWNYSQKKFLWSTADGSGATEIWMATAVDSIVYDKWIHLVMIRNNSDPKKGYFYINGVRYELASVPAIRNIATAPYTLALGKCWSNSYYLKAYYNDFRIYDHALSPKEVKLLSQGLVCHYKLSDGGFQENLFYWQNKGKSPITLNTYQNRGSFTQFSRCLTFDASTTVGQTYTISFWARSVNGTTRLQLYNSNSTPRYFYFSTILTETLGSEWQYFTYTFTNQDRGTGATDPGAVNRIEIYMPSQIGGEVREIKIEKGSTATVWSPAPLDSSYSELGYDENIVYDSSGYNNHSTLNLSTSVSSDSPRNLVSTLFGAKDTPKSTFINTSLLSSLTNCTVCWWEKPITTANMLLFSSDTTHYIGAGSTSRDFYDSIIGSNGISFYRDGVLCTTTYSGNNVNHAGTKHIQNEWHHYALSGINVSSWAQFYINTYNSYPTQSYLSDVRIYATVLSAEDIQQLYNTPVSVTNTGAMMTQGEFVEVVT